MTIEGRLVLRPEDNLAAIAVANSISRDRGRRAGKHRVGMPHAATAAIVATDQNRAAAQAAGRIQRRIDEVDRQPVECDVATQACRRRGILRSRRKDRIRCDDNHAAALCACHGRDGAVEFDVVDGLNLIDAA